MIPTLDEWMDGWMDDGWMMDGWISWWLCFRLCTDRHCAAPPVCQQVLLPGFLTAPWHPPGCGHRTPPLSLSAPVVASRHSYLSPGPWGLFAEKWSCLLKQITVATLTPSLHVAWDVFVSARKSGINSRVVVRSVCSCVNEFTEVLNIVSPAPELLAAAVVSPYSSQYKCRPLQF